MRERSKHTFQAGATETAPWSVEEWSPPEAHPLTFAPTLHTATWWVEDHSALDRPCSAA
jgi:hypothetical protein